MLKSELRQLVIGDLKQQDSILKQEMDKWLIHSLLQHPAYRVAKTVATYLFMPFEVSTEALIKQALADGKRVLVPKVIGKGKMIFVDYDASSLKQSSFGVWEPDSDKEVLACDIDLIHVPGVAFDTKGYRIGFGGGFYDRYLATFSGWTLSTAYPFQMRTFERDEYDIPVREVIQYDKNS